MQEVREKHVMSVFHEGIRCCCCSGAPIPDEATCTFHGTSATPNTTSGKSSSSCAVELTLSAPPPPPSLPLPLALPFSCTGASHARGLYRDGIAMRTDTCSAASSVTGGGGDDCSSAGVDALSFASDAGCEDGGFDDNDDERWKNGQRRTRRTMFPDPAPAPVSERMTDGRTPVAGPSGLGTPFPESFSDRIFAETGCG